MTQPKSATVDGSTLTLTYEENLDEGVTLPASAFTVTVNSGGRAVNGVSVSGTTVNLTLASAVAAGETVKVGYAKPDGPNFIRDTLGREGDSFSDHAVTNNTPEALPQQQEVVNTPATGVPTISGTAQVGEMLTADLSGITDADGKPSDAQGFGYQWVRVDGMTATEIAGATAPRYSLADADVGKTIKVTVSFTDMAGFSEGPLTSDATDPVTPKPSSSATGQPTISGTAQVGETLTADTSGIADADGLDNVSFSYQWIADDSDIAGATGSTYTLAAADEGKVVKVRVRFTDDRGHAETLTSTATVAVAAKPSSPATGQPAITGTAEVGETLTADTSGIADADGLDNVSFSYQWIADDSDIAGATGSTYTLAAADESKVVKVRVSFTDDRGHAETLTSTATVAVAAKPSSPATGQPAITGTAGGRGGRDADGGHVGHR